MVFSISSKETQSEIAVLISSAIFGWQHNCLSVTLNLSTLAFAKYALYIILSVFEKLSQTIFSIIGGNLFSVSTLDFVFLLKNDFVMCCNTVLLFHKVVVSIFS